MTTLENYQLTSSAGLTLELLNYGARVRALKIPINGKETNVVLGYEKDQDYLKDEFYMGASIGRFSNRIHGGSITINNEKFPLAINESQGMNTLHGGDNGFDKRYWQLHEVSKERIEFKLLSPHLDQGFPGNLDVRAIYTVEDLGFSIQYTAISDKDTLVSICNHAYFNLDGFNAEQQHTLHDQQLFIDAHSYLPLNKNSVPIGHYQNVTQSPFDFHHPNFINHHSNLADCLDSKHPQIELVGGLDHTFVLNRTGENTIETVAQLYSKKTDLALSVKTTQAAMHVYTGNYLNNKYLKNSGICLETQGFPDAPNHKIFPSSVLAAGEKYSHKTEYNFHTNFLNS